MKFQRGFTLIELLVVIAIISLLSSVVLASVRQARDRAAYTRFDSDFLQLKTAIELYKSDHEGEYPYTIKTFSALNSVVAELNSSGYFSAGELTAPNGYFLTEPIFPANSTILAEANAENPNIVDILTCGSPDESSGNYSLTFYTDSNLLYTSKLPLSYLNGVNQAVGRTYCIEV